jgi:hypothetical protein
MWLINLNWSSGEWKQRDENGQKRERGVTKGTAQQRSHERNDADAGRLF